MTGVLSPAVQAAYRALAPFRLQAEVRRDAAVQIVSALSEIPVELLPGVVNLGEISGVVGELSMRLWQIPVSRRREAVAAGAAAAAQVLCGAVS